MVKKMEESLDTIDRRVMSVLQQDGRIALVDLANRIGLSPTATTERVKRLTREGYILGYSARLAPEKLQLGLLVFIEVKLDRTTLDFCCAELLTMPDSRDHSGELPISRAN